MEVYVNKAVSENDLSPDPENNRESVATFRETPDVSTITFSVKRWRFNRVLACVCVLLLAACVVFAVLYVLEARKGKESDHNESKNPTCYTAECLQIASQLTRNMNTSIDPCMDFYHFACDGWLQRNPIPPSENTMISFQKLSTVINGKLRSILEAEDGSSGDDIVTKMGVYYKSCFYQDDKNDLSKSDLQGLISRLGSWSMLNSTWNSTTWNMTQSLLEMQRYLPLTSPLFSVEVQVNPRVSTRYIIQVLQLKMQGNDRIFSDRDCVFILCVPSRFELENILIFI